MRLIRSLISLAILGLLIYLGATVNLGTRTFFGHVANIWRSEEAAELRHDVGKTAGPILDKARRGAEAGWEEATRHDDSATGSGDQGGSDAKAPVLDGGVSLDAKGK